MEQGRVDFRRAIQHAANRGIAVHTIYCGDYNAGVRHGWADAAYMGGGMFTALEQDAWDDNSYYPQDNDLWSYNSRLNDTYIPYGQYGRDRWDRQRRQDRNAYGYGRRYAAQRAMYKASRGYRCPDWDLVDAVVIGRINLREVPANDLPPEMRSMTIAQRQAYINRKAEERRNIRLKMKKLADARQQTVSREDRRAATNAPSRANGALKSQPRQATSLNQAIRQSVGKKMNKKPIEAPTASGATNATNSNTYRNNTGPSTSRTKPRPTGTSTRGGSYTRPTTSGTSPRSSSVNRTNNTRMNSSNTGRSSTSSTRRQSTTVNRSTDTRNNSSSARSSRTVTRPSTSRTSRTSPSVNRSSNTRSTSTRSTSSQVRKVNTPPKPRASTPRPAPKPSPRVRPQPSKKVVNTRTVRSTGTTKKDTKAKPASSRSSRSTYFKKN